MTEETSVKLTRQQWSKINAVIVQEARRLNIVPAGSVSMGVHTEWGEDTPSLVFDVERK
jgi:hypothetical protein